MFKPKLGLFAGLLVICLSGCCVDHSHYFYRTIDSVQAHLERQPDYADLEFEALSAWPDTLRFMSTARAQYLLHTQYLIDSTLREFDRIMPGFYAEISDLDSSLAGSSHHQLLSDSRNSMILLRDSLARCKPVLDSIYLAEKAGFDSLRYYFSNYHFQKPFGDRIYVVDTSTFEVLYYKPCDTCLFESIR